MSGRWSLGGVTAFALTAALLGLLCALQAWALWRAPPAWSPALISVTLEPGESITLGQAELAAPQADRSHVGLRRDPAGRWYVRNVSGARQLVLQRDGVDRRTGGGQHWRYDGATLLRDGAAQPSCPDARPATRLAAAWNRAVPPALALARPLAFGGNLYCDNRLGLEHVDSGSAVLARVKGRLLLSGAAGGGEHAPLLLSSGAGQFDLAQKEEALDGVSALVAGRTRFGLQIEGGRLELRPASHAALFAEARNQLPPQVSWQWRLRQSWALPPGPAWWVALALCGALLLAGAHAWQRGHCRPAPHRGWRWGCAVRWPWPAPSHGSADTGRSCAMPAPARAAPVSAPRCWRSPVSPP
jgi:cell division protein FtsW